MPILATSLIASAEAPLMRWYFPMAASAISLASPVETNCGVEVLLV